MEEEVGINVRTGLLSRVNKKLNKNTTIKEPTKSSASTFADYGVHPSLCNALKSLNITTPTEIQKSCMAEIMNGRDCIASAKTGSGKTIAFGLPILQHLTKDPYGICAIILTPTRELAFQIADQFHALGGHLNLRAPVVVGGMDMMEQAIELQRRPHVVIATPGRFADLLKSKGEEWNLNKVKYLVLDEADRLLSTTFAPELSEIFSHLPTKRQTLLFTATATPAIISLKDKKPAEGKQPPFVHLLQDDHSTPESLQQLYVHVPSHVRDVYLHHLLINPPEIVEDQRHTPPDLSNPVSKSAFDEQSKKRKRKEKVLSEEDLEILAFQPVPTIIFTARCQTAAQLTTELQQMKVRCAPLHSYLNQAERLHSLSLFRGGVIPVLVATDVGSRGLDIPEVALVVNYDLPRDPNDYIHRVGRTARAGRIGVSVSFVAERDVDLVEAIEKHTGVTMEEHSMNENKVLENMNKVFTARRVANLALHDSKFGEKQKINKAKNKKRRKYEKEFLEGAG
ncbi:DEAD-domain-containing protein [Wallemia mellicola CBS 633.66]|uniref:DEAD-domain-containing protein n=2 Tax=Wallemia mellicola TaxID=1708541 RepID=A0A4T0NVT3_9BASI|nr:DEAD-domain-containing protein [Wallemia mellicola CBS 633.66]TIB68816.1 hypothetical protein E3Q24_03540 [Wallemia mellicola]EIM22525.1 DEAD-domain-containing protein [Wallemia mellicola CBS 633.66]TIB72873.1 hypothetical protein E3Q23_03240 [Wallemia mellicola]TIB82578.1 DEAD-domain-containing protein [Wallemia mellicola]TIB85267.1 DEAD-domain-containing protein [Wallemia mellicola]|eukprot:XP_006957197.1 DEAD-domain-containing protein [Wallemia mellicola CBS 633.66]